MPTLASSNISNLRLLDRPDLVLTLTKINLWRLVQFRKCVYVDADVLALRAPDELFALDVEFAVLLPTSINLIPRLHQMLDGLIFLIRYGFITFTANTRVYFYSSRAWRHIMLSRHLQKVE
jgi:alpha-N-acetylglucosamine transferase